MTFFYTCTFLFLFVIHVWHPHFPLNGIKKYLTWLDLYLCVCVCVCVTVGSTSSVNNVQHTHAFLKGKYFEPKLVAVLHWNRSKFGKFISDIFWAINRGHNPIKWDLEWPSRPSFSFSLQQHLVYHNTHSNVEDYKIENKTYADTENGWKKIMTASISVSSSCQVSSLMTTGWAGYLLCCSSLENDACTLFQSIQTFCEQQIHWEFPLSNIIALSFVFDTCVHHVLLISFDTTKVMPYIPECLICGSFHFWAKFQGMYLTPRSSL